MEKMNTETLVAEPKEKHAYKVGEFEGPLDLLWALIHESKINIYDGNAILIINLSEEYI